MKDLGQHASGHTETSRVRVVEDPKELGKLVWRNIVYHDGSRFRATLSHISRSHWPCQFFLEILRLPFKEISVYPEMYGCDLHGCKFLLPRKQNAGANAPARRDLLQ